MAAVTGQHVADFLGQGDDTSLVALASEHAAIVTALARSYTRGRGFAEAEPAEDIAAVIVTATARLVANPEQLASDFGSVSMRGGWQGWNLAEQIVLNRYRVRAQ
ncbi:MAG: hypothetical protein K0U84_07660 [Actinomycetia bacterium]|nr:hypothetical protein [Actinomycetes bacterium]